MLRSDLDRRRVRFASRVVVALAGFHGESAARERQRSFTSFHVIPPVICARGCARTQRETAALWIPLGDQAVRKANARVHGLRAIGIEVDDRRFHPDRRLELRQVLLSVRPLMLVGFRMVTKHGRSDGPLKGVHSTARPSGPATDVNVPHSCATRSGLVGSPARGPECPDMAEVPTNISGSRISAPSRFSS